jgi:hypothetical protein
VVALAEIEAGAGGGFRRGEHDASVVFTRSRMVRLAGWMLIGMHHIASLSGDQLSVQLIYQIAFIDGDDK